MVPIVMSLAGDLPDGSGVQGTMSARCFVVSCVLLLLLLVSGQRTLSFERYF